VKLINQPNCSKENNNTEQFFVKEEKKAEKQVLSFPPLPSCLYL